LFDAEMSIEWVATAGRRAAALSADILTTTRVELVAALTPAAQDHRPRLHAARRRAAARRL
jgi:hypothetical protein